jgi:subtilisin family serine protease
VFPFTPVYNVNGVQRQMGNTRRRAIGIFSGAIGAAVVLTSCTQFVKTGLRAEQAPEAEASSIFSLASAMRRSTSLLTTKTTSLALDRIDQRDLPLDATYRRTGSGRGVTVYVFDGGISPTHPELAGRVRVGFTAFPSDPKICNAHGTAVAGAIAGSTLGVAPEADIVDVKMVQCGTLRGTIKGIVDGAKWTIEDHKRRGGAAIANWSFIADTAQDIPALDSAVAALRAAGIPVIVSAGNVDQNACKISPANAVGTIVVGASAVAIDSTNGRRITSDTRAQNTAWGPCVDVFAPGDSVLLPSLDTDLKPISQLWNGTSMSAGYASGAAALFLEIAPRATPDEVGEFLRRSATPGVIRNAGGEAGRLLYVGIPVNQTRTVALNGPSR